jgi:hypothetical protein
MLPDLMFRAEEQPAAVNASVGLTAADVGQSAINFRFTARVIAHRGHSVANIAVPVAVKSE